MCVSSLSHPACKVQVPYYIVVCGLSGCTIFLCIVSETAPFLGGKNLLNIKCVFWFSLQYLLEIFLIVWRIQWDIIRNVHKSSCKELVILVRFERNLNFFHKCFKNTQISNLMKICPMELSCSMWKDRQTDRHDEANSCFSQFCECAWLWRYSYVCVCVCVCETRITATALQDVMPGKLVGTRHNDFENCWFSL